MNRRSKCSTGAAVTLLAVALAGCAGPGATTGTPAAQAQAAATLSGKVVETMDAGGYTYISLERDGKLMWVAAPVMKVAVGQELKLLPGAEMTNFNSKALNRTFDKIVFSGGLAQGSAPMPPSAEEVANESAEPILAGKVVETMDAMQYTYIKLEKDGKTSWAAVPATQVAVGEEIELLPGTAMGKFTSKVLNRTFNAIYFASGVKGKEAAPAPKASRPAAGAAGAADPAAALPSGHPKIDTSSAPKAPVPVPADQLVTGKVVETVDAGGYTYICLEKDGKKSWAAVPPAKVTVGQELALTPGVTMSNFVSKSLNRTFDKILFSGGIQRQ